MSTTIDALSTSPPPETDRMTRGSRSRRTSTNLTAVAVAVAVAVLIVITGVLVLVGVARAQAGTHDAAAVHVVSDVAL